MGIRGDWDVVICGAGMAGLCAAVAATEAGVRPLVVEKGPRPGGSMRMSGGTVWTAPSMAVMERYVPGGDRVRQKQLVDGIGPNLAWLAGLGVTFTSPIALERQVGQELDVNALTERLVKLITAAGGEVAMSTAMDSIELTDGRVSGVRVREADGRRISVETSAVILATGGFGGNHELLARYVGRYADRLLRRANPHSVGEGLLAALEVGARTSPNLSTFYGHTMPAPPADPPPNLWTAVTQYFSQDAILVNEQGERFFDESVSLSDEMAPIEIVQQTNARAFLLFDERIYRGDDLPGRSAARVGPNFDNAVAAGGPSVLARTLPELIGGVAAWGVSRRGLEATIEEFNEAVSSGRGAELRVSRANSQIGLVEAPFRALAVRPAVTFTLGGIDVDAEFHVLSRDGQPIPGLFAAGADAGGTYQGGYMGGLVLGLVQGPIAGRAAAREVGASRE